MSLPTPRDYAGVHRVDWVCVACDHFAELDLFELVNIGLGDVPLIELPLRCSACGKRGHRVIVSGRSYGVGEHPENAEWLTQGSGSGSHSVRDRLTC